MKAICSHTIWQGGSLDSYRLLALSVIYQAIIETRRGDHDAAAWLIREGIDWLDACGVSIDSDYWQNWVTTGCPKNGRYKNSRSKILFAHKQDTEIKKTGP